MMDPILITGCARSGTSLTAGIVSICGGFGGDMFGPNRHNQKGMFENREIRQNIVKPYLKRMRVDPLGQRPLPNNRQVFEVSKKQMEEWRSRIQLIIQAQGYIDGLWFYKGAKICLIWYLWAEAFPNAKWVLVRRNKHDIANSCLRTSFMRAYNGKAGWLKWVEAHEKRFQEMKAAKLDIVEFWPSRVIEGDFVYVKAFVETLGLEYRENLLRAFIDPSLYRRASNG